MKAPTLNPAVFTGNRDRLRQAMLPNSLAVVNANDILPTNADGTMAFHQSADLFYLTGIDQEETILVLAPQAFDETLREVLLIRQPTNC